jgi:putative ABC transport system permease protein
MTISKQVKFFFSTDLGYNKDQLLVISAFPKQWDSAGVVKMQSIRDGLLRSSVVKDATVSFEVPERTSPGQIRVVPVGSKDNQELSIQSVSVDDKYGSTFGLHLMEGRFLRDQIGGFVSGETVINASAMNRFGWKTAVGHHLQVVGGGELTIVGVVKDFHMASMHESIGPLSLRHVKDARAYRYLTVKLQGGNPLGQVESVKAAWKDLSPGSPFDYFFMDEKVQAMYESELQLQKAAGIATGLMLVIVLLGIFGVLTLALAKRNKEIAVRKVLGAEIHHILSLFIKQYLALLLIANGIAWPLTYYFSNQWLRQYAYRINQPVSIYLTSGIFVAAIAIVLIALQCLKVAMANPVTSLRSE